MVTPRVAAEARRHFDCDKLEGAELEDQGGEGTALTHWEKRILEVSFKYNNFECSVFRELNMHYFDLFT